jgi:hypothetical protein
MLNGPNIREAAGGNVSRIPASEPGIGWDFSEIIV